LRQGIELGTDMNIYKGLNLNISYTFSDFNYKTYSAKIIEIDSTGNIVESDKDFSCNIVPSVPKHNIYLAISYTALITNNFTGFLKLSYRGVSINLPFLSIAIPGSPPCRVIGSPAQVSLPFQLMPPSVVT